MAAWSWLRGCSGYQDGSGGTALAAPAWPRGSEGGRMVGTDGDGRYLKSGFGTCGWFIIKGVGVGTLFGAASCSSKQARKRELNE